MESMTIKCPECGHSMEADMVVHVGGVNDYGWWVLRCGGCGHVFDTYVGRDVNDSSLTEGGEILERIDQDEHDEAAVKDRVKAYRDEAQMR